MFKDSLEDVEGKNIQERQRIDKHFEAGVTAGCWTRGEFKGSPSKP